WAMSETYGDGPTYRLQVGDDLGSRLAEAVATAFVEGVRHVIVIGADCPAIEPALLDRARRELNAHDVVIGPACDGGYYLIAIKRFQPQLFANIQWGSDVVHAQTLVAAKRLGLKVFQLPMLQDIDRPEDLVACRQAGLEAFDVFPTALKAQISIVIPTLNEAVRIASVVGRLRKVNHVEIIVADGGSEDGTAMLAREAGAMVVTCNRGRGHQLNAGAAMTSGDVLLFLHADTELPDDFAEHVRDVLRRGAIVGAFRLRFDDHGWRLRSVERFANIRSRVFRLPYGDQALFVDSRRFFALGGFRNWPIMEDYEWVLRTRTRGKVLLADTFVTTSSRRWKKYGIYRTTVRNQLMLMAYHFGISPDRLARFYYGR
ncbi:MAG: TIGR04283 family arsenosugar biosynthesis glycosyltransferase, partial [Planctomycetales bacterium]|nr:TIGR04283 family arsenosugar biosynthesis glycosyltransferase [Planctomycetales bacterium]